LTGIRIIFVPGLKPKPPPEIHRRELMRVLLAGLERRRPLAARRLAEDPERFVLVSWTRLFYGTERDIAPDLPGIERLLAQRSPTPEDRAELESVGPKLLRVLHIVGDSLPALGRWMARPALRLTMLEARRYQTDRDGIATVVRSLLRTPLEAAWAAGERVLLIGHSFGSVIAYDTLWELSRETELPGRVDLFVTLGSPLATRFIRRSLCGAQSEGPWRYPGNIKRWANFAARADVTALYPRLRPFFLDMLAFGLVESIDDYVELDNYFRGDIGLNAHESYGYLLQRALAELVGDWIERP
jgi:hypothetical protein